MAKKEKINLYDFVRNKSSFGDSLIQATMDMKNNGNEKYFDPSNVYVERSFYGGDNYGRDENGNMVIDFQYDPYISDQDSAYNAALMESAMYDQNGYIPSENDKKSIQLAYPNYKQPYFVNRYLRMLKNQGKTDWEIFNTLYPGSFPQGFDIKNFFDDQGNFTGWKEGGLTGHLYNMEGGWTNTAPRLKNFHNILKAIKDVAYNDYFNPNVQYAKNGCKTKSSLISKRKI